jgi:hypothetical protein
MSIFTAEVHVSAYVRTRNGLPEYVCEHTRSYPFYNK